MTPRIGFVFARAGSSASPPLVAAHSAQKMLSDKHVFSFLLQVWLVCFSALLDIGNSSLCLFSLDSFPQDRSEFSMDYWGEPWLGLRIIAASGCATVSLMISFKLFTCTVSVSSAVKCG